MRRCLIGNLELATIDRGTGSPPVLLVHGFPLDHTMWNAQIEALSRRHRVIAPDLRGFGQSDLTAGTVTMEQFADDLAALLDALGVDEPVVFCGLSMGGYVAWPFWRKYASRTQALILCDTRALADTPDVAQARRHTADRVVAEGPSILVDAMFPKLFAETSLETRPETAMSLRRVMLATDPRGIAAAARGMAQRPDVTAMLPTIDCPTLVLVGQHDVISTPEEMRAMARAIPGATFLEVPGAGHMTPMEAPEAVNAALLEFLGP